MRQALPSAPPRRRGAPLGRLLVGVDGSSSAQAALRWAAGLARRTGAEVIAVHARVPVEDLFPDGMRAVEVESRLAGAWTAPLQAAGVRHRTVVAHGPVVPCLLETARAAHADLIVVGRALGANQWRDAALGNVSGVLTQQAEIPVVVVPG